MFSVRNLQGVASYGIKGSRLRNHPLHRENLGAKDYEGARRERRAKKGKGKEEGSSYGLVTPLKTGMSNSYQTVLQHL